MSSNNKYIKEAHSYLPTARRVRKKKQSLPNAFKNAVLNSNGLLTASHGSHAGSSPVAIGRGHVLALECVDPTIWRTANYIFYVLTRNGSC